MFIFSKFNPQKVRKFTSNKIMEKNSTIKKLAYCVMMTAIALGIVAVTLVTYKPKANFHAVSYSESDYLKKMSASLNSARPEVLFIGNSMLECGLNDGLFGQLTETRTIKMFRGGSASAVWYLYFKNLITKIENKPDKVILYFRDKILTMPDFRTDGKYLDYIRMITTNDEPVLELVLHNDGISISDSFMLKYLPFVYERADTREKLSSFIRGRSIEATTLYSAGYSDLALKEVFQPGNMDKSLFTIAQLEAEEEIGNVSERFQDQLEKSFLPHIVELVNQNDIELILVRVRKRMYAEGKSEPQYMKEYIADLQAYLDSNNVKLLDYTHCDEIDITMFENGDHLTKQKGKDTFTRILANDFNKIYKDKKVAGTGKNTGSKVN